MFDPLCNEFVNRLCRAVGLGVLTENLGRQRFFLRAELFIGLDLVKLGDYPDDCVSMAKILSPRGLLSFC